MKTVSSTVAQLSWNSVVGAQGYRIYWWNGFRVIYLGSVGAAATSVRITNLAPGSTSQFLVEAYGGGMVADSTWVSVTTPTSTARSSNSLVPAWTGWYF